MKGGIHKRPEELLQRLIRFDTTNPPGDEAACIDYIGGLLEDSGLEAQVLGKTPSRMNVVSRLKGEGSAPPLLMYGHVDVVTTAGQKWSVDPFEGRIADGFVWGRGSLDMKGGLAMMLAALLRAKAEGIVPAGDIIFAALSDEEAGGDFGAKYLVENHQKYFEGIRYAIGEFGGFPMYYAGKKFYAIQVSEKQICWLKATVRGPGGHGALPMRNGTMARLADLLQKLNDNRLPVHIEPTTRQMLQTMADEVSDPEKGELTRLLDPKTTDATLDEMGDRGRILDSLLHNTVNASVVRGGSKINVIPSEVSVELDGRLLPGFIPDDILAELRDVVGDEVEFEVICYDEGPSKIDMDFFDTLAGVLSRLDPSGPVVPLVIMGCTDARFLAQLGIQSYGFIPMNLPADFDFMRTIHSADERIPIESLYFGTNAVFQLLQEYKG